MASTPIKKTGLRAKVGSLGGLAAGLAAALVCSGSAQAQTQGSAASKDSALHQHVMKARQVAGGDLQWDYYHRCFVDPNYTSTIAKLRKASAPMEPVKVFDQLYFVGQNDVSSWVLKTSAGLIVFDTQNNTADAKQFVEAGMVKLGLDPKQIKYVFIMHEHADHFGGAGYVKSLAPGARLMATSIAWSNMAKPTTRGHDLAPIKAGDDGDIVDGQKFTLGDTTIRFYNTPGHTDGTLSAIFNVTDNGAPHVVGFFGGMGSPQTESNRQKIIQSFARWQQITKTARVDTLIANHQGQDHSVEKLEFIKVRQPGDPNPYVLGNETYERYFTVQSECTKANLARHGQNED